MSFSWKMVLAAVAGLLAACGGSGGASRSADSGPADGGPGWTSDWLFEVERVVHDESPCEDWDTGIAPPERALPTDPTPRVLWKMVVGEDPLGGAERGASEAFAMAAAPQGHLWVLGPEYAARSWLAVRDGEIVWRGDDIGLLGDFAVAPDGSLIQRGGQSPGEPEGFDLPDDLASRLVRIGPPPRYEVRSFSLPSHGHQRAPVVVGPAGAVYTMGAGNRFYATCRGERVAWEMHLRAAPGLVAEWGAPRVTAGGDVFLSAYALDVAANEVRAAQMLHLDATGQVVSRFPATPDRSERFEVRGPFEGADLLVQERRGDAVRFGVTDGSAPLEWWTAERTYMAESRPTHSRWELGPGGELWLLSSLDGLQRFTRPFYPAPYAEGDGVDPDVQWFTEEPGRTLFVSGRRVWLENGDGSEAWDVRDDAYPIQAYRGPSSAVLDYDGILYVASSFVLYAIQTDVLPPPRGTCFNQGCNPRQNGWMGSP